MASSTRSAEGTLRSLNSNVPVTVRFRNRSNQIVQVYWLDFQGKRVLYNLLPPGGQYAQRTFLTHPWIFTDVHEVAFQVYLPQWHKRAVDILPPKS